MYSYHATIPVSWLESNHQQRYLDSAGYFCSDVELKMAFLFNSLISRSSRSLLAGPGVVMELLVTLLSHCDDESGLRIAWCSPSILLLPLVFYYRTSQVGEHPSPVSNPQS